MQNSSHSPENFFHYFNYTQEDMDWQLYVTTIGHVHINPGDPYPYQWEKHPKPYTHNWSSGRILSEFQFVYIVEGSGIFRSFHGEFPVSAGTMLVLVPGERYWYVPDHDTGWTEYWLGFNGESAQRWLEKRFIQRENNLFHVGYNRAIISLFNQAVQFADDEPAGMQQLISSLVPQILARLQSIRKDRGGRDDTDSLLERAKILFEENLYSRYDIESITGALKVNYRTLREYFKEQTGLSPYHYFLQMKINKAKELLLQDDMNVKTVSFKLAFDNPYYFSRLFKKKTGVPPSRWHLVHVNYDLEL